MSENQNMPIERNLNWEVRPYQGVGVIDFGMTREEVRKIMKEKYEEEAGIDNGADNFFDTSIFVHYDEEGKSEAVVIWEDEVVYNDNRFVEKTFKDIIDFLSENDTDATTGDFTGILSPKLGLYFYTELPKEDEEIKYVVVFKKGYADKENALAIS